MSLLQIELLKEAAQVDLVLGALYVVLGSFGDDTGCFNHD